ncbi:MAG: hypothetical protein IJT30_09825 [Muribaculaceae bacterium]|nr:hypothetical protein [Muribaculaceae bacterium]
MKFKSLLLVAAAFAAVGTQAQTLSAPDLEVNAETAKAPIAVPLTLTRAEGSTDFTNFQVNLTLPEGLDVALVTVDDAENYIFALDGDPLNPDNFYVEAGTDIKTSGRPPVPVVSFTTNFDEPTNWPNYDIVGANLSKTANTKDPSHIVTFYVKAKDGYTGGTRGITAYCKYTQYDDSSFEVGKPDARVPICNVTFTAPDAVQDVNVAKAVSSVKYYNAAGVASDNAFEGVNIVVTKYADGSQSVVKVVK